MYNCLCTDRNEKEIKHKRERTSGFLPILEMAFLAARYLQTLEVLKNANPKLRKAILKNADSGVIDAVGEICHNYLCGNILCNKKQFGELAKHKEDIRRLVVLCKKSSGKKCMKRKERNILLQKGEGFWFALLAPVVAELSSYLVGKALK